MRLSISRRMSSAVSPGTVRRSRYTSHSEGTALSEAATLVIRDMTSVRRGPGIFISSRLVRSTRWIISAIS